MEVERIPTADGVPVVATFHGQEHPKSSLKGAVLVAPAMGVPQTYYTPFAAWLAEQGYLVATFDYRGIGLSRPTQLRGFRADILSWGRLDCAAVLAAMSARAPGLPIFWIGHSVGIQMLPFIPGLDGITKAISIASGSGYWRENAAPLRRRAPWLWYGIVPACTAIFGYFPGRHLKIVGDLPKGVVIQWRRWCLHPDYALSEGEWARAAYAAVTTPIVFFSFTDDEYMSDAGRASMSRWYARAPQIHRRISPADIGVPRIGHLGFFRLGFVQALWQVYLLPELT